MKKNRNKQKARDFMNHLQASHKPAFRTSKQNLKPGVINAQILNYLLEITNKPNFFQLK